MRLFHYRNFILATTIFFIGTQKIASADFLDIPSGFVDFEGVGTEAGMLRSNGVTIQNLYSESMLGGLPHGYILTGFSYRLDGTHVNTPTPATNLLFNDYSIIISTTNLTPSQLSSVFSNNTGSNPILVRHGSLSIPAHSYSFGDIPNKFGPTIAFDIPFVYNGGNLLIEVRHTGNGVETPEVDAFGGGLSQDLWGSVVDSFSNTAATGIVGGNVVARRIEFLSASAPEPSAAAFLSLCAMPAAGMLRRRAR